jgi:hypothetical protein
MFAWDGFQPPATHPVEAVSNARIRLLVCIRGLPLSDFCSIQGDRTCSWNCGSIKRYTALNGAYHQMSRSIETQCEFEPILAIDNAKCYGLAMDIQIKALATGTQRSVSLVTMEIGYHRLKLMVVTFKFQENGIRS